MLTTPKRATRRAAVMMLEPCPPKLIEEMTIRTRAIAISSGGDDTVRSWIMTDEDIAEVVHAATMYGGLKMVAFMEREAGVGRVITPGNIRRSYDSIRMLWDAHFAQPVTATESRVIVRMFALAARTIDKILRIIRRRA
jgi:hypothetical protein